MDLSPTISGCLHRTPNVYEIQSKTYRPLYRAVYANIVRTSIVSVYLIAHYIGLSTLRKQRMTHREMESYRPLYRAVYQMKLMKDKVTCSYRPLYRAVYLILIMVITITS